MPTTPTATTQSRTLPPSLHRSAVLGLLLAAFALRLHNLGGESLWYDETVSAYLALLAPADLIRHTALDIHPPGYYLLLHLWQRLTSPSPAFGLEFLLAWPSLWFGLVGLALTYAIARRWLGRQAAWVALAAATLQPFQLWSAQEVRMYAVGACGLLLTLWAVLPWLGAAAPGRPAEPRRIGPLRLAVYALASAAGLYTLYYFVFWLAVLNFCLMFAVWKLSRERLKWIAANLAAFGLWLPWLPTFLRQALTPPVPPWRVPWTLPQDLLAALGEGLAGQLTAHTLPLDRVWLWAALVLLVFAAYFVYTKQRAVVLAALTLGPLLLLTAVSSLGPPIYHVRYLATYAPLFPLVLAALVAALPVRRRTVGWTLLALCAAVNIAGLRLLWTDPRYAADDHRQAVADLAANWRPGDAILVNAGWVYTALDVYWPRDLGSPQAAIPPAIQGFPRLGAPPGMFDPTTGPMVFRTGSVDGDPQLGWGLPESDFFAMPLAEAQTALRALAGESTRLWHYRLYDTVSDPDAKLRGWIDQSFARTWDHTYPGPGYLRVERYALGSESPPAAGIGFANGMQLAVAPLPGTLPAGSYLYVDAAWTVPDEIAPGTLGVSIRLYDAEGFRIAQVDEALPAVLADGVVRQPFGLPIPAATSPGPLRLGILLYDTATLTPVSADAATPTVEGAVALGQVTVTLPAIVPAVPQRLARFDYIDLVAADLPPTIAAASGAVETMWVWRPRPSSYRDDYTVQLLLGIGDSTLRPWAEYALGAPNYPSSRWAPGYPVNRRVRLDPPADLPPGDYRVYVRLVRAADGKIIPAAGWFGLKAERVEIGSVTLTP